MGTFGLVELESHQTLVITINVHGSQHIEPRTNFGWVQFQKEWLSATSAITLHAVTRTIWFQERMLKTCKIVLKKEEQVTDLKPDKSHQVCQQGNDLEY
jgi:hypothetical protein